MPDCLLQEMLMLLWVVTPHFKPDTFLGAAETVAGVMANNNVLHKMRKIFVDFCRFFITISLLT